MTQACLIEALVPDTDCCCETEATPDVPPESSCAQCITLDTGANHSLLARLAASVPVFIEDLMASVARQASLERIDLPANCRFEGPAESPPVWQLVARTSVPVRGPSFA